jgi:hypothetical protein
MKRILCVFLLFIVPAACGSDNSSTVELAFDGNGCLVQAGNFDWTEEWEVDGFRTVNYRWECAEYTSPITGESLSDRRVTLTFTGTACLELTSELVNEGFCEEAKIN